MQICCKYADMLRCCWGAEVHRCTGVQVYRCTGAHVHRCSRDIEVHTEVQIYKYAEVLRLL